MRRRIVQSLFACLVLMGTGGLNVEAKVLRRATFLSLPIGQQASVERWKDSLCACIESGQYAYVCIEANAIDMMYNNQYVLGSAALSNLMEESGHLVSVHELPFPCDESGRYRELLQYALEHIRVHNQKEMEKLQVVGLSYDAPPYIAFDSRVWHVAQYNKTGLTDSLMTYLIDEESDTQQLSRLTIIKLDTHCKRLKKSLGKLDYFIWKQFFVRGLSRDMRNGHQMQCEYYQLFDQTFKGRKLIIGCPSLKELILHGPQQKKN